MSGEEPQIRLVPVEKLPLAPEAEETQLLSLLTGIPPEDLERAGAFHWRMEFVQVDG